MCILAGGIHGRRCGRWIRILAKHLLLSACIRRLMGDGINKELSTRQTEV